jgi:hypothetical protein
MLHVHASHATMRRSGADSGWLGDWDRIGLIKIGIQEPTGRRAAPCSRCSSGAAAKQAAAMLPRWLASWPAVDLLVRLTTVRQPYTLY